MSVSTHKTAALIFMVTIGVACGLGYVYFSPSGQGIRCDQCLYFLQLFRLLDPSFCQNDWLLGVFSDYHFTFTSLLHSLAGFFPLEWGVFAIWIFLLVLLVSTCRLIVGQTHLSDGIGVTLLCVLCVFGQDKGWGFNSPTLNSLLPNTIGLIFSFLGVALLMRQTLGWAGLAFGIAGLFHVNYLSCNALMVLGFGVISYGRFSLRAVVSFVLCFVIAAFPMIVHVTSSYLASDPGGFDAYALDVIVRKRAPFHFSPRDWGIDVHLVTLTVFGLGGLAYVRGTQEAAKKILLLICFAYGFTYLSAFVFTEIVPWSLVVSLFLWRTIPLVFFICYALIVKWFIYALENNKSFELLLASLAFVIPLVARVSPGVGFIWCVILFVCSGLENRISILSLVLLCLGGGVLVYGLQMGPGVLIERGWRFIVVGGYGALVALGAWRIGRARLLTRHPVWHGVLIIPFLIHPLKPSPLLEAHLSIQRSPLQRWVQRGTQPGEVFLVPPLWADFRAKTGRAIYVDWKAFPRLNRNIREWAHRMDQIGWIGGYKELSPARVVEIDKRVHLDYVVIQDQRHANVFERAGYSRVYQDREGTIFRLPRPD